MMSETVIDQPVDDTDSSYKECIGCGREVDKDSTRLCLQCWSDAEVENE